MVAWGVPDRESMNKVVNFRTSETVAFQIVPDSLVESAPGPLHVKKHTTLTVIIRRVRVPGALRPAPSLTKTESSYE